MADKKPPFSFGGAKPPAFGAGKAPSFASPKSPGPAAPKGPAGSFAPPSAPLKPGTDTKHSAPSGDSYSNLLRSKIDQARKTLDESIARKKEKIEVRELYWMGILKEKEQEAETIRQEMKSSLDKMELSQAEKENSLRSALEQFEGRLMSVSRELEDEKKKSYRSMQKAKEESEASLKVEMALKEIVSSKDYEDKLEHMQAARENLLKDMIRQKDNFNREKAALEEQISSLSEQASRQREIIARHESNETIFETQKEKDIASTRREAELKLEDLLNQVKSREESVRLKENEFRMGELVNRQRLDDMSADLRRKESELNALRDTASRLERELHAARQAVDEGNAKFAREIEWLKKHFEEERRALTARLAEESRLRKESASSHTDVVRERDSVSRALAEVRARESDLSGRLAEKEKELTALKSAFEREKDEVRGIYESGLKDITAARDALLHELELADASVKRLAEDKTRLTEELRAAQARLSEKEAAVSELAHKIKEISSQIQATEQRSEGALKVFEQEKQELISLIGNLESEKEDLLRDQNVQAGRLHQLTEEIAGKTKELAALEADARLNAEEYERGKALLESRTRNLEDEKNAFDRKIAAASADYGSLKEQLSLHEARASLAATQQGEARAVIESLNKRHAETEQEMANAREGEKELRAKISGYEKEIEALGKDILSLKEERVKDLAFNDENLKKARAEIESLNSRLNGILEEKSKLSENYKAVSEELFEMTKQRDALFNEKNALASDLSDANERIENLIGEATEQSEKLAASGADIALLNDRLKALGAERQSETVELKNKILEQHKKMEELFARINEYNIEIESLKSEPGQSLEEYKQELVDREKVNEQLRAQIEELRAEKERSAENITENYDSRIAELELKLSETGAEIEQMRASARRAAELDSEIVKKDAQLKEASAEIQELRSSIAALEDEKRISRGKSDAEIAAIKEDYERRLSEAEENAAAFEKTRAQIDELRTQAGALSDENAALRKSLDSSSAESGELRALAEQRGQEIDGLKESLSMTAGETAAAYDEKIKSLAATASENLAKAAGFEESLREAEKEIARLQEESSSGSAQADEFRSKLADLEAIIEKQKQDISVKMEYIKSKELEFHKILKKKDEDISVLKAQLELGLEALEGKVAAPSGGRLAHLEKLNDEIRIKAAQREAMLKEEIERKEKEAAEYRNQIKQFSASSPTGLSPASRELENELKSRDSESARLKAEMERARKYHEKLENIIKKQDEKISQLQSGEQPGGIIKKHDITDDGGGDIRF